MTDPALPLHLFPIACKHCRTTLATLDLRSHRLRIMAEVKWFVELRKQRLVFICPSCGRRRYLESKALGATLVSAA